MSILDFAKNKWQDLPGLTAYLNGLSHEQRVAETRKLGRGHQKTLYEAVDGYKPIDLNYFIPSTVPDGTPVDHVGWNSQIPGFRSFTKVMMRPKDQPEAIWGYNEGHLRPYVGPGYFVVESEEDKVGINYYNDAPGKHESWPEIKSNTAGITRFIYGNMIDNMRYVSDHVSIGRAIRHGKLTGNWFLLVRKDGA